ncbi:MAG: nucleotide sugar dehydrogenase [Candidatus Zhuqueibacterota bacterium]
MLDQKNDFNNISIVGLGRLGVSLAACFAEKGYSILGFDEDNYKRKMFQKGLAPVLETGLDDLLKENRPRLKSAPNYFDIVNHSRVTFVTVANFQELSGAFSSKPLETILTHLAAEIKLKDNFHLIVIVSATMPGTIDQVLLPMLEKQTGKECGAGFGLCYWPDFTTPGRTIHDVRQPEIAILGQSDVNSGDAIVDLLHKIIEDRAPIQRMNFINAEVARIAAFTYLATKLSFSHVFAEMCESLPGADWSALLKSLNLDGQEKLKIDTWLANPFNIRLSHENRALRYLYSQHTKATPLVETVESLLSRQVHRMMDIIFKYLPEGGRVGILGLASLPQTDIVKNSPGIKLATWLYKQDIPVTVYDPLAMAVAREAMMDNVSYAGSIEEIFAACDMFVLATAWPEFAALPVNVLKQKLNRPIILDCCHILDQSEYRQLADVLTQGVGDLLLKPKRSRTDYDYSLVDLLSISNIHSN